jgi:tRNA-specific 2-thiouridylase
LKKNKKVIVGLSGGVDSSVAAYLLKKQGYDVTGVTMAIWGGTYDAVPTGKHSCYGPDEQEEIREAGEVAAMLGIPHHVFDCSVRYKAQVLDYFKAEYLSGRTPNPCIKCNQLIKFGMLPDVARKERLDFDYFATGHYAKIEKDASSGRYLLKKATDTRKDQTYFIYRLSQEQLSTVLFPLGGLTKDEVRRLASEIDIPLSEKSESQDFYSGDYKELLDVKDNPGDIIDSRGIVLGKHAGIWNYTIGQRKGLGIAFSEPLYVISLDRENNTVVVGTRGEVMGSAFLVTDLNWISVEYLDRPMQVRTRIRSAQKEAEAIIEPVDSTSVKVTFITPNDGITPGQSAVFYRDDIVVGGGTINSVLKNNDQDEKINVTGRDLSYT